MTQVLSDFAIKCDSVQSSPILKTYGDTLTSAPWRAKDYRGVWRRDAAAVVQIIVSRTGSVCGVVCKGGKTRMLNRLSGTREKIGVENPVCFKQKPSNRDQRVERKV